MHIPLTIPSGYIIIFTTDSKSEAEYITKRIPYKTKIISLEIFTPKTLFGKKRVLFGYYYICVLSEIFEKIVKNYNPLIPNDEDKRILKLSNKYKKDRA